MLTQSFVKEHFTYNDGELLLKKKYSQRCGVKIGEKIGTISLDGYLRVSMNYKKYNIHRLVFLYHYGYLPKIIDHINRNKLDNRIENLRVATHKENTYNIGLKSTNKTTYKGVCYDKRINKFKANITNDYKKEHLGYFNTAEEASYAYQKRAKELHGDFAYITASI